MMVGLKHDDKEPRTELIPPTAIIEVTRALTYDAHTYSDNNYRETPDGTRRYTASALRFIFAFMRGEAKHPKSEVSNLAHAVAELMYVLENGGDAKEFTKFKKRRGGHEDESEND